MLTPEDKLASLERKVMMLQLRHDLDERKTQENTPAALATDLRELNQNMTELLGITGSRSKDINAIQNDMRSLKDSLTSIEGKLEQVLQLLSNRS